MILFLFLQILCHLLVVIQFRCSSLLHLSNLILINLSVLIYYYTCTFRTTTKNAYGFTIGSSSSLCILFSDLLLNTNLMTIIGRGVSITLFTLIGACSVKRYKAASNTNKCPPYMLLWKGELLVDLGKNTIKQMRKTIYCFIYILTIKEVSFIHFCTVILQRFIIFTRNLNK